MDTDQLQLKNYRGLKNHSTQQSAFTSHLLNHYLMIFLFQLIFTEREQFSGPHCTTISRIYLFGDGKTAFVRAFIRALI